MTSSRANIRTALEKAVIETWGFSDGAPARNTELSETLLPDTFYELVGLWLNQFPIILNCLSQVVRGGVIPFGDPFIKKACHVALFETEQGIGLRFPDYFNPVPWRFIAFIGTIVRSIYPFI